MNWSDVSFVKIFETTAWKILHEIHSAGKEMDRIVEVFKAGEKMGIYPCNRYSRKILRVLKKKHPELFSKIVVAFDGSDNLNFMEGLNVRKLDDIHKFDIDKLLVTSSKFPSDQKADVTAVGVPQEKMFVTSLFREELSQYGPEEVMDGISRVLSILSDHKSRVVYMLTWFSLLLLEKEILSVFESPVDFDYSPKGEVSYSGMTLSNIESKECQYGLALEIYRTEKVFPEQGDTVFDIGAYRGDTAAFFRKYIGESGNVYAFEPDDVNFRFLLENIKSNCMNNVVPVKKAILEGRKRCSLIATPRSGSFLYVLKDEVDTESVTEIDAITIDGFVQIENIEKVDFIKSDIEGCEMEMFEGAVETIKSFRPKLAIAIYHSIFDIINIPLLINSINPGYEIYIRHYVPVEPWEIILYARNRKD